MKSKNYRLRELDFLRGVAILLVLFRHQLLFSFAHTMGWIGVDLFFVLSGFLVSGLLFREYSATQKIQPGRFLIRRGFKIYPIYYLTYFFYLIPILISGKFNSIGFLSDLIFIQNYTWGFGYAYAASWSLAIEEHFYFTIAILLWLALKNNWIKLIVEPEKKGFSQVEKIILLIMTLCLVLRIFSNKMYPENHVLNFTMTHLRIDSLLAGVLVSYLFNFRIQRLKNIFSKNKMALLLIAIAGICWTPFIEPMHSFFAMTIGFSLLYVSFGILLIAFLLINDINLKLNKIFSTAVVNLVCKIGYCSYSIYIIHSIVIVSVAALDIKYGLLKNNYAEFVLATLLSIVIGIILTRSIERFFLKIRDNYFPGKVNGIARKIAE